MAGSTKFLWQAAFVAYCNGTPEEEISQVFSIPLDTLQARMSFEGWAGLRVKMPMAVTTGGTQLPAKVEAKLAIIEENRANNFAVFARLRNRLLEKLKAWEEGTLRVEKVFNNKGQIVTHDAEPGPGDWVNIATFAQTIAQGSYRALGDFQAGDKPGQDAVAGQLQAPQGPAITIILPGAVAYPRQERGLKDGQGQVIDVSAVQERPRAPEVQPITPPAAD